MGHVRWFSLGTAEKLSLEPQGEPAKLVHDLLMEELYPLFERHIQLNHLQFHHYCQPRQNESIQGRTQFEEKNRLTLEPVLNELEALYLSSEPTQHPSVVYLHLADANLDELTCCRGDLLARLQRLVQGGSVILGGGILDEAFIGPDPAPFSVAAILAYYEKLFHLFGDRGVAPLVWIPERFFEEKTTEILESVYQHSSFLQQFPYLSIIVDENVIEHSLPEDFTGNIFTGWINPAFPSLRIFVGSNMLRAMMPQASPSEINDYFFSVMNSAWDADTKASVDWFIDGFERWIHRYAELNERLDISKDEVEPLCAEISRFYLEARDRLSTVDPIDLYFVDDLEKNGSWKGTAEFAFSEKRHFFHALKQAQNTFNPYHMKPLKTRRPHFQVIRKIKPSSYKEFSVIWNNNPLDVETWRVLTRQFLQAGIQSIEQLRSLSAEQLQSMRMTHVEAKWYLNFVRSPVSWQEGQLSKYPEIRLNYILAQLIYQEIVGGQEIDPGELFRYLMDDTDAQGHLLHIWNKNRASCPNFIGFFGGASILFFRLHIATQLAAILMLKYDGLDSFEKELVGEYRGSEIRWTLIKMNNTIKIIDEKGDTLFYFSEMNFHNLVSGFSRHREGYNSIIKHFIQGRQDVENFALTDKSSGTTSSHPLVIALDLDQMESCDLIRKTYPEDLDDFDEEQAMLNPFPIAWEQVWILPPNTFENPILNYQEGYFGDFKWIATEKYRDEIEGHRVITFVRHAMIEHKLIDIIKKINPKTGSVRVEIWNRSNVEAQMTPTIAFPTSLDWHEGEAYSVEGEALPVGGEVRTFDQNAITLIDKISNLKLTLNSLRSDVRFSLSTVYTYQTSDKGAYTVSPQHELILLSSRDAVTLQPGQCYEFEYIVNLGALTADALWQVDWNHVPVLLRNKIHQFAQIFLQDETFTAFQKLKLIYCRFPEIIFWVK